MDEVSIRLYESVDLEEIAQLWHTSKRQAFPFVEAEQKRSLEENRRRLEKSVLPECDLWLAQREGEIVGMMALGGKWIDQLFVKIGQQRMGVGSLLIEKAKILSPAGLLALTFERNLAGRSFFEKHGFVIVGKGFVSTPKLEPDLEYHWAGQSASEL